MVAPINQTSATANESSERDKNRNLLAKAFSLGTTLCLLFDRVGNVWAMAISPEKLLEVVDCWSQPKDHRDLLEYFAEIQPNEVHKFEIKSFAIRDSLKAAATNKRRCDLAIKLKEHRDFVYAEIDPPFPDDVVDLLNGIASELYSKELMKDVLQSMQDLLRAMDSFFGKRDSKERALFRLGFEAVACHTCSLMRFAEEFERKTEVKTSEPETKWDLDLRQLLKETQSSVPSLIQIDVDTLATEKIHDSISSALNSPEIAEDGRLGLVAYPESLELGRRGYKVRKRFSPAVWSLVIPLVKSKNSSGLVKHDDLCSKYKSRYGQKAGKELIRSQVYKCNKVLRKLDIRIDSDRDLGYFMKDLLPPTNHRS